MNRRAFIEKTGILGSAALLPPSSFSNFRTHKYKMGLQLYTIHEDVTRDTIATLKTAKAMGYEDFATFGFEWRKWF